MARVRGEEAWRKWRAIISAQATSEQTVTAFCRERKLCVPHFYWWKRRLLERGAPAGFVELTATPAAELELRLGPGRSLVVRPGFDPALLREVIAALEEQP